MSMFACATGQDQTFVLDDALEVPVHRGIVSSVQRLKMAGQQQGFDIRIASGYRSFERQRRIWNQKASGERAVLDAEGEKMDIQQMTSEELMFAILRWSALPGASRHHWGTDIDIYDQAALGEGQCCELTVEETQCGGVFFNLYQWLPEYLSLPSSDFYRPYAGASSLMLRHKNPEETLVIRGVACEPWHLSCISVAKEFEKVWSYDALHAFYLNSDIMLKNTIVKNFECIYERYISPEKYRNQNNG